jgi:hypothetical protein
LLADLAARCADAGDAPAEVARLAALDLCAGLVAFGGLRTLGELIGWIGRQAPARIVELMACADLAEPPVRSAPQAGGLELRGGADRGGFEPIPYATDGEPKTVALAPPLS